MSGAPARRRAPFLDRVFSPTTLVLAGAYLALLALYAWQASRRSTITLFTDEIELTQLSRSIAETGHATLRGGAPSHGFPGLWPYVIAPWWWIHDVGTAYAAIKLTGVAFMTAVLFPAYALGRVVLGTGWAAAAAIASAATPALAYSPFLVKEPLTYPLATLGLLLTVRLLARPSWGRGVAALAAAIAGWLARSQLAVLLVVLALTCLVLVWDAERARRWRRSWSRGDWLGAGMLALGAVVFLNVLISHRSGTWYLTTTFFKDRIYHYAIWAAGAFAIGIGLLPVIAALASLARPRRSREERAVAVVSAIAIVVFGVYAGVKAAYLSTNLANLIVERNLIYLAPLVFVGAALFLSRRDTPIWALAASTAFALHLVVNADYSLASYPNYEAHGLAIAALANREFRWTEGTIQNVLVVVVLGSGAVLAAVLLIRATAAAKALAAAAAAAVLAWSLTGEIYAARGEKAASDAAYSTLPTPADWLDRTIGRNARAVFLGQQITPYPVWQLEFWNRSLKDVWSLDATAPGPGRVTTPDLGAADGTLSPDPGDGYVVAAPGVDVSGRELGEPVGGLRLYPLHDGPIKLARAQTGVAPDGWMGSTAHYSQYDVPRGAMQFAHIFLSREAWCGKDVPGKVRIRLGPIGVNEARQEYMKRVTARAAWTIHACKGQGFDLRAPGQPWGVDVEITPTFSPHELDPSIGDARQLGARVDFGTIQLGSG